MVLEKTLESPLDCKDIQPVHLKGDQSLVFIGGTDAEAEAPVFGHLVGRVDSLEMTMMLGKIEVRRSGQQDDIIGWYHQLNGHEFGSTLGVGDGQGGLVCCSSWGCKEPGTTERLN